MRILTNTRYEFINNRRRAYLISGIAISTALTLLIIPILFFSAFHKRAHTLVPQGDPS